MRKIVVPTDFSNNAYESLFYATRLFQDKTCHFYILNTFDVNTPMLTSRLDTEKGHQLYHTLSKESKEKLTETLHKIVRDSEDLKHTFETISVSKDLTETINKTIKSKDIDLVVMGTKGATGAREIFMGSNTVKVIQKIKKCPILAVLDGFDFQKPMEIGFPTDFKRVYLEEELKPLMDIASLFNARIRIFHIHEEETLDEVQEVNRTILKQHLRNFAISVHWISKFSKKSEHITDFITKMNIDILSMVNYRHSIMEMITHEPVIKKIGFHATIPFLVIPEAS